MRKGKVGGEKRAGEETKIERARDAKQASDG